jgi:hypothetical protein
MVDGEEGAGDDEGTVGTSSVSSSVESTILSSPRGHSSRWDISRPSW